MSPLFCESNPPKIVSNVVLPEPDAPFNITNSPSFTSKFIPFNTGVSDGPLPNVFLISFTCKLIILHLQLLQ